MFNSSNKNADQIINKVLSKRDIQALIKYGVLTQNPGGGRSTHYRLMEKITVGES